VEDGMAIFMKHPKIAGAVTAVGFEKWIELVGCAWNTTRDLALGGASASARDAAAAIAGDVVCRKTVDTSSVDLLREALIGDTAATAEIHFTTTDLQGRHVARREVTLTNALVVSYSIEAVDADGTAPPSETFTLTFTKIRIRDHNLDRDLRKRETSTFEHDYHSGKAS
jgi:type VI secretion system secreted protein Hcp